MEEKKLPKQTKPALPPPVQRLTNTSLESKSSDRPTESKSSESLPNIKDEHKAPISPPTSTNAQPKFFDRAPESKIRAPNHRDDRKAVTPTPNRQRSSSVLINKPGNSTASSCSTRYGVVSQGNKPSSLTPTWKLRSLLKPRNGKMRGLLITSRGSVALQQDVVVKKNALPLDCMAKTETVPVPEPAVSDPGRAVFRKYCGSLNSESRWLLSFPRSSPLVPFSMRSSFGALVLTTAFTSALAVTVGDFGLGHDVSY